MPRHTELQTPKPTGPKPQPSYLEGTGGRLRNALKAVAKRDGVTFQEPNPPKDAA